jgi:hypothetical protein
MYKIYDAIRTILNAVGDLTLRIIQLLSGIASLLFGLLLALLSYDYLFPGEKEPISEDRLTVTFYLTIASFIVFYISKQFIDMDNKK